MSHSPDLRADSPPSTVTVSTVTDEPGFLALRPEWDTLLDASSCDSPFLAWEWLWAWWRHLGGTLQLHLLTARDADGLLVGVVPLSRAAHGPLGMARLEFLGTGTVASDHLDAVIRRGFEPRVIRALAGHFSDHKAPAQLDHVRTPDADVARLGDALAGEGWTVRSQSIGVCPYMRIGGHTWDSFLGTLGSSHRANVRRRIRGLGQQMTFELVDTEARRQAVMPDLITLHNQRWGERGGTAFHTQASRDFHDEATRLLLERGRLRLYVLTLNGEVAAVQYLLAFKGRFSFYQHGYDARFSSQSVGLVSFALAIQAAIEEGATEFDMLWGDEGYKSLWMHDSRDLLRIDLFPPDAGGIVQRLATDATSVLKSSAKRLLKGSGR